MTRRDASWRAAGVAVFVGAFSIAATLDGSPLIVLLLPMMLVGLTLMINGKRVAIAFRAERRGHWHTAEAIHAERVRRHRRRLG